MAVASAEDGEGSTSEKFDDTGTEKEQKNKFQRRKDWIDIVFKFGLMIAAGFGFFEYLDRKHQTKIRHALQIVDDWEDQNYLENFRDFNTLTSLVLQQAEQKYPNDTQSSTKYASNIIDDMTTNAEAYESAASKINADNVDIPNYTKFTISVERLNYFYGKAGLCVQDAICEPNLMKRYFGASSCYFFNIMDTQIKRKRIEFNNPSISEFTEYFCKLAP